jgi:hypothetical protein
MAWRLSDDGMNRVKVTLAAAAAVAAASIAMRKMFSRHAQQPQHPDILAGQPVKWIIDKAGDMSRLYLAPAQAASMAPDSVRVAVHFVGLNFADVCACQGLCASLLPNSCALRPVIICDDPCSYSATPSGAFTPGLEFSGVVADIGANVRSVTCCTTFVRQRKMQ